MAVSTLLTDDFVAREDLRYAGRWPDAPSVWRSLFGAAAEHAPWVVETLRSRRFGALRSWLTFDLPLGARLFGTERFLRRAGVELEELFDDPRGLDTARKLFGRRLRYWERRPLAATAWSVTVPCDGLLTLGAPAFELRLDELLGGREPWTSLFAGGESVVVRVSPERCHWNHAPVSGRVTNIFALSQAEEAVTPFARCRRVVTVIDTDWPGGSRVGMVCMVEVAPEGGGSVLQRYSATGWDAPRAIGPGSWIERGQPKSLFQAGSRPERAATVLLFAAERARFPGLLPGTERPVQARSALGVSVREG